MVCFSYSSSFIRILLFAVLTLFSCHVSANRNTVYLEQLIAKARSEKTWTLREWQVLMHYSSALVNNDLTSLVDDTKFFLSEKGKTSPQAELESTLHHLFKISEDNNSAIACRFPGRLVWLTKVLNIDEKHLPQYQCTLLKTWLKNLESDGITLVFPVSVLNSPPSMFGHTFLRLDHKKEKKPDLLAWTVNYAARSEGTKGLSFALNGLLGGYPGKFSLAPYYVRVKEYSDIESRDIWEYQLNFSPQEIHSLLLHLWEILPVHFDYYFIDENCSYQLLSLLEAARPQLRLSEQFYWDAAPAATVRAITSTHNLLKSINYRPSNQQIILERAKNIGKKEQQLAQQLARKEISLNSPGLINQEISSRAKILELTHDYVAYQVAISKKKKPNLFDSDERSISQKQQLLHQVLVARSQLAIKSQQPKISAPQYRPDQGHKGHRMTLQYGYENSLHYQQLGFRWAFHDQDDPSTGFIKGAQLEFFKPAVRYYSQTNYFQLEAINFVNLISTPIRDYFIRPFSWEVSAGVKRYQFNKNNRPLMGDFKAGIGVTYPLNANSEISFFANTSLKIADDFNQLFALGSGGRVQFISTLGDAWKVGVHAQITQYYQGISQTSFSVGTTQRFSLNQNNAIVFNIAETQEFGDVFFKTNLSWHYYF